MLIENRGDYYLIGVMSGTSLDGVDLAYVHFFKNEKWDFNILEAKTVSYSSDWLEKLKKAVTFSNSELEELDVSYTSLLSDMINKFIRDFNIGNIDAVCSHGHTVLHKPQDNITFQIGNLPILSKLINQNVVCDFRVQDVELGGQGAPLVPVGDKLLFTQFDYCVNLGGFSNVSIDVNSQRIAYDICPVNIVLNHYIQKTGVSYDDKGSVASSGVVNNLLFEELNSIDFYQESPPKSLGLEWVKMCVFPLIDKFNLPLEDVLRTFVEHVAFQISKALDVNKATVLFTGGGVYNTFLMERIESISDLNVFIPEKHLIEYKEALIFAFLGLLRLQNQVNVLASVTGAEKDHSSGYIFLKD